MSSNAQEQEDSLRLSGWTVFAAIWLVVAGFFNVIDGFTVIHKSNYVVNQFLFANPSFWGWVLVIVGIVQIVAGVMVFGRNPTGYTLGLGVAGLAIVAWFFFIFVSPVGSLIALIANGLVIYGLCIGKDPYR